MLLLLRKNKEISTQTLLQLQDAQMDIFQELSKVEELLLIDQERRIMVLEPAKMQVVIKFSFN